MHDIFLTSKNYSIVNFDYFEKTQLINFATSLNLRSKNFATQAVIKRLLKNLNKIHKLLFIKIWIL